MSTPWHPHTTLAMQSKPWYCSLLLFPSAGLFAALIYFTMLVAELPPFLTLVPSFNFPHLQPCASSQPPLPSSTFVVGSPLAPPPACPPPKQNSDCPPPTPCLPPLPLPPSPSCPPPSCPPSIPCPSPSLPPRLPSVNANSLHPPISFKSLYEEAEPVCTREGKNLVLKTSDRGNFPDIRPWSLHPKTYQSPPHLPPCKTASQLLQSLKLGQRKDLKSSGNSYFEPHGCNYKWYTPEEMCEISSRYSTIYLVGDSLARHTTQGIFMLYTGDLVYGGIPRFSGRQVYEQCACDGQFSEHIVCRDNSGSMYSSESSHAYGICPLTEAFRLRYTRYVTFPPRHLRQLQNNRRILKKKQKEAAGAYVDDPVPDFGFLCTPDPRPSVLLMQGGIHMVLNSDNTASSFVTPLMKSLQGIVSGCEYNITVKVVWSGMICQSEFLDALYPHQACENAARFNEAMSSYVLSTFDVETLHFLNLTRNAAFSDGVHGLAETNLLRAMYLYNLLDLWS